MDGQYLICRKIEVVDLLAALMCNDESITLKVTTFERKGEREGVKTELTFELVVTEIKHQKESPGKSPERKSGIEFVGYTKIKETKTFFRAYLYKEPKKNLFGMMTNILFKKRRRK